MGRRPTYSEDHWNAILDQLAEGQPLAAICRKPGMPSLRRAYEKIEQDPEFAAAFRARKAIGVRAMVDDTLAIADERVDDPIKVADKRVRIDTRLRLAGMWLRHEFGNKVDVNHGGSVNVTIGRDDERTL